MNKSSSITRNSSSSCIRRNSSSSSISSMSSLFTGSVSSDFGNESENITLSNKVVYRRRSKDKPLNEPLARTPTPTYFLQLLEQNKRYIDEAFREHPLVTENCSVKKGKKKSSGSKEPDE